MKGTTIKKHHMLIALIFVFSVTAVLTLVVYTLAYFKSDSTAENYLYSKTLKVDLIDVFDSNKLVLPGDTFNKDVYMRNTGELNAVVRIKLTKSWNPLVDTSGKTLLTDVVNVTFGDTASQDWTQIGEWYYYNKVLRPGEETTKLVDSIKLLAVSNDIHDINYSDATFELDVLSQSLQALSASTEENWGMVYVSEGDIIIWSESGGTGG
jgi:hypothetical protein